MPTIAAEALSSFLLSEEEQISQVSLVEEASRDESDSLDDEDLNTSDPAAKRDQVLHQIVAKLLT